MNNQKKNSEHYHRFSDNVPQNKSLLPTRLTLIATDPVCRLRRPIPGAQHLRAAQGRLLLRREADRPSFQAVPGRLPAAERRGLPSVSVARAGTPPPPPPVLPTASRRRRRRRWLPSGRAEHPAPAAAPGRHHVAQRAVGARQGAVAVALGHGGPAPEAGRRDGPRPGFHRANHRVAVETGTIINVPPSNIPVNAGRVQPPSTYRASCRIRR